MTIDLKLNQHTTAHSKEEVSSFIENNINPQLRKPVTEINVNNLNNITKVYLGFESSTPKPVFAEYTITANENAYQSNGTINFDDNLDVQIRNYLNK